MANTYEEEIISLPSEDILGKEPIIVKGGAHPPEPHRGASTTASIEIHLGELFDHGWTLQKNGGLTTITIKSDAKWVINEDPYNRNKAIIECPGSRFGKLKIRGFKGRPGGNQSDQEPDPDPVTYHSQRGVEIQVVDMSEP